MWGLINFHPDVSSKPVLPNVPEGLYPSDGESTAVPRHSESTKLLWDVEELKRRRHQAGFSRTAGLALPELDAGMTGIKGWIESQSAARDAGDEEGWDDKEEADKRFVSTRPWTAAETLQLLEAIAAEEKIVLANAASDSPKPAGRPSKIRLKRGGRTAKVLNSTFRELDWDKIAERLENRSAAECIAQFLKLPVEEAVADDLVRHDLAKVLYAKERELSSLPEAVSNGEVPAAEEGDAQMEDGAAPSTSGESDKSFVRWASLACFHQAIKAVDLLQGSLARLPPSIAKAATDAAQEAVDRYLAQVEGSEKPADLSEEEMITLSSDLAERAVHARLLMDEKRKESGDHFLGLVSLMASSVSEKVAFWNLSSLVVVAGTRALGSVY